MIIANNAISVHEHYLTLEEGNTVQNQSIKTKGQNVDSLISQDNSNQPPVKNTHSYISSELRNSHAKILLYRRLQLKEKIEVMKKFNCKNHFKNSVSTSVTR